MIIGDDGKGRCFGGGCAKGLYARYHDEEWGLPSHDDRHLFEMLILEGAQAGLSWETILKKREGYRRAFHNFDPSLVAAMSDRELEKLLEEPSIVRNRLKVMSARKNGRAFLAIQEEFGSFDRFIWDFVDGVPIRGLYRSVEELPASTALSDRISKELKRRGMSFVGSTIIYSYMQAVGLVNDHLAGCFRSE